MVKVTSVLGSIAIQSSEQCKSRLCSQNIAGGRATFFRIISLRPQFSQNELDVDGIHLVMQNYKHEASLENEFGSAL